MNNKKKNNKISEFDKISAVYASLFVIFLITIIVVLIKLSNYFDKKKENEIQKNGKETIARIYERGSNKSTQHAYFEYYVNDKKYSFKSHLPNGAFYYEGEFFNLYYAPKDPEEAVVDYTCPIYLISQKIDTVHACIETILDEEQNIVYYTYIAHYENRYRTQQLPLNKKCFVGDSCSVEYLVDNPNVSRIILQSLRGKF